MGAWPKRDEKLLKIFGKKSRARANNQLDSIHVGEFVELTLTQKRPRTDERSKTEIHRVVSRGDRGIAHVVVTCRHDLLL